MVDNATDQDGKEFFTIMAADESVFYLVIDRQRETENVYFLNAVTVADLMALAEPSPEAVPEPLPEPEPEPATEPEPEPEPEKIRRGGDAPAGAGGAGPRRRGRVVLQDLPPQTAGRRAPARILTRPWNTARTMAAVSMTTSPWDEEEEKEDGE